MVVSASRRTDIPAFCCAWFLAALRRGKAFVRHPFRPGLEKSVSLRRADVDAFVFWTRNPVPFLPALDVLDRSGFPYSFLVTVNHYPHLLEPCVPDLPAAASFMRRLRDQIGAERIVWRYDPVVFTPHMGVAFHRKNFSLLATKLQSCCRRVIVSFVDPYAKVEGRLRRGGVACLWPESRPEWVRELLASFRGVCDDLGLEIQSCAETIDTAAWGVPPGKCIDEGLLNRVFGLQLRYKKDPGQRRHCLCHQSIDIGTYGTCRADCLYCYAR